jgi:hypothetical protein
MIYAQFEQSLNFNAYRGLILSAKSWLNMLLTLFVAGPPFL